MKKNIGSIDKALRLIFALIVTTLYYFQMISGTVAIIFGSLAFIFLVTSLISFCPLYVPFKISTKEKEK